MLRQLDEKTFVSGQIAPGDLADLKAQGVTMVVNNRPDGEDPDQPQGVDIEAAAEREGLAYRHVPIIRGIGPSDVESMREAMEEANGKILAFCRSGTRSTMVWALARREQGAPLEEIERSASAAGVSLDPIRHLL